MASQKFQPRNPRRRNRVGRLIFNPGVAAIAFAGLMIGTVGPASADQARYSSSWQKSHDGAFVSPDIWTNPLQDWRVRSGALECFSAGSDRNAYLLTHEVGDDPTRLEMSVDIARLTDGAKNGGLFGFLSSKKSTSFVGFRFGVKGLYSDFRDRAFHGVGAKAGVNLDGTLFIGDMAGAKIPLNDNPITLKLVAEPEDDGYRLVLSATDAQKNLLGRAVHESFPFEEFTGGLGLTCHTGGEIERVPSKKVRPRFPRRGTDTDISRNDPVARFGFRNWSIESEALIEDQSHAFGPINFTLYSVSRGILKLTAQMMPLARLAGEQVTLELKWPGSNDFTSVQTATIDAESYTAQFRLENWDTRDAVPYRVTYRMRDNIGETTLHTYAGEFRAEPAPGNQLTVASLSCQFDEGYPHQDMQKNVLGFDPDMVFFTGDQIYEFNAGYGKVTTSSDEARLDYLRKWYQFGWAFRDLLRDRPSIVLPDDHDVFQGGIWGEAGKALKGGPHRGGYMMSPTWLNMMQRTQTGHLPDPYDPSPVLRDIEVYYTDLVYGGVSFAVLEDRKWKSGPEQYFAPNWIKWKSRLGLTFDPTKDADIDGAELLGDRQLEFLERWSADWSDDVRIKAVVSATPFSAINTVSRTPKNIFRGAPSPAVDAGSYPENDILAVDFESNGWPQTPRNSALRAMRKGFAFHIAGDVHLGAVVQYGIDDWRDGAWAVVSPAISNLAPRRWFPAELPADYVPGEPRNLGNFRDGFGNYLTYRAVANPTKTDLEPRRINELAPGFNIINFDTTDQSIAIQAWPRWIDPQVQGARQYDGWPVAFKHLDNGYPMDGPSLPTLVGLKTDTPVVQVVDEGTKEIVYTVRMTGTSLSPRVFAPGTYTVRIYDSDMKLLNEFTSLTADANNSE